MVGAELFLFKGQNRVEELLFYEHFCSYDFILFPHLQGRFNYMSSAFRIF